MAKRKIISDSEDQLASDDSEVSDTESKPKSRTRSKRTKKEAAHAESDQENLASNEDEPPLAKKVKKAPAQKKQGTTSGAGNLVVHSTSEGDKYIELGKKKRATVRSFKGTPLIDIREFYGADGDEKPGKKGISLTLEQWETLKSGSSTIDDFSHHFKQKNSNGFR